jgi:ribonuclease D
MNETTRRATALRNLSWHLARTRQLATEQSVLRESAIREFGLAHPRSIAARRQLRRTLGAQRSYEQRLRQATSDQQRSYRRDHPGSWEDHQR